MAPPKTLKPLKLIERKKRGGEEVPRWRRHLPPLERLPPRPPMRFPTRPEVRPDKEALRQDTRAKLEAAAQPWWRQPQPKPTAAEVATRAAVVAKEVTVGDIRDP